MTLSALSTMSMLLDQFALPADTLMVSPLAALDTQLATLARSGVLVQLGLPPVQAADTSNVHPSQTVTNTARAACNRNLFKGRPPCSTLKKDNHRSQLSEAPCKSHAIR
jgi:hypothetical protein